jgi:hypothetical protein
MAVYDPFKDPPPAKGGSIADPFASGYQAPTIAGEFKKGISSGIDNLQASLYGLAGMSGDFTGIEPLKKMGLEGYQRNTAEAEENAPAVGRIEDVGGVKDAALYAAGGLGSLVPFVASSAVTGGAGGVAGQLLARKGLEKTAGALIASGVDRALVDTAAKDALSTAAERGAIAGAGAQSIGVEQGSIYGDIKEKTGKEEAGTAALYGIGAGLLDVLPEARMVHGLMRGGAGKAAKSTLGEGGWQAIRARGRDRGCADGRGERGSGAHRPEARRAHAGGHQRDPELGRDRWPGRRRGRWWRAPVPEVHERPSGRQRGPRERHGTADADHEGLPDARAAGQARVHRVPERARVDEPGGVQRRVEGRRREGARRVDGQDHVAREPDLRGPGEQPRRQHERRSEDGLQSQRNYAPPADPADPYAPDTIFGDLRKAHVLEQPHLDESQSLADVAASPSPRLPESGPLSRVANVGIDTGATSLINPPALAAAAQEQQKKGGEAKPARAPVTLDQAGNIIPEGATNASEVRGDQGRGDRAGTANAGGQDQGRADLQRPTQAGPEAGHGQGGEEAQVASKEEPPQWWKDRTPAERLAVLKGSGVKGTAITPWHRLSAEDRAKLNEQWGSKPAPAVEAAAPVKAGRGRRRR